jgi:hypothetical protein
LEINHDLSKNQVTCGPTGLSVRCIVNPIIAKFLAVGAAFSRASRLQGAPRRPDQNLTSGEFRKQHEIVIASCKSCGEMDCRVGLRQTTSAQSVITHVDDPIGRLYCATRMENHHEDLQIRTRPGASSELLNTNRESLLSH